MEFSHQNITIGFPSGWVPAPFRFILVKFPTTPKKMQIHAIKLAGLRC
jgi:hypothetical protein